tara:strand:- start:73 stop:288 length:216 start_codon:yes stop_codon:yes gene_type:complete
MAKLKKYRVHKAICPTCNGNGFVKVTKEDKEPHIHQCWDCDSEGEFYVHEPEVIQPGNYVDPVTGDVVKLN